VLPALGARRTRLPAFSGLLSGRRFVWLWPRQR
jgi:hypothetical protein